MQSIQYSGNKAINLDIRSQVGNIIPPKREVCPEIFLGKDQRYGYPFFRKGFEGINCTEFLPINQLVTILAILPDELSIEKQYQVPSHGKVLSECKCSLALETSLPADFVTGLKLNLTTLVSKDLTRGET